MVGVVGVVRVHGDAFPRLAVRVEGAALLPEHDADVGAWCVWVCRVTGYLLSND